MVRMPRWWPLLLSILWCAPAAAAPAETAEPGLVVLGVACTAKDPDWRTGLVGFGIQNWVAQALYDTCRFRMLEEKAEVLNALQPRLEITYEAAERANRKELEPIAAALQADRIAVARVSSFYARPQGLTLGPLHSMRRDTFVKVEVVLYDAATGTTVRGEGTGKVGRTGTTVGADIAGGKLPFDPSTVGAATREAVENAVAKLVPGYRPRERAGTPPALARPVVIGVLPLALRPEVARLYPDLATRRVGLGIHNRVLSAVGATEGCRLQEINPEVLKALELQWWVGQRGAPPADEVAQQARDLSSQLDWVIYGEVFSFAVRKREKVKGLTGEVNSEVTVGVQLRAVSPGAQPAQYFVASGIGREEGDWESWQGGQVEFAQSIVGRAATRAVASAWPALLHDLAARLPAAR